MNMLKTGAMIKAAALMGCIAANATQAEFKAAETYARNIGLAFQVKDDLLDNGEEDDKTTYLSFISEAEAENYVSLLTAEAITAIDDIKNNSMLKDIAIFLKDRTA